MAAGRVNETCRNRKEGAISICQSEVKAGELELTWVEGSEGPGPSCDWQRRKGGGGRERCGRRLTEQR